MIFRDIELDAKISNLQHTVLFLTEIQPSRTYNNIGSLNKVASYIHKQFSDLGLSVERQEFDVDGTIYSNIIGSIGSENSDRIILGAHYDVCGEQPGADDNASAVAGLIEAARLILPFGDRLRHRVDFVAYTLEEPP